MVETIIYGGGKLRGYSLGDYAIEAGAPPDVRAERKAVGAAVVSRFASRSRFVFRRTWSHIRADATDATMLWFVKCGRLSLSNQAGPVIAEPGQLLVTRSMAPFRVECLTDADGVHAVLNLALPTHAARDFIPDAVATGFCAPADQRGFSVALSILTNLLEDEDEIASDTAELLMSAALAAIGHAIRDRYPCRRLRQSVADRRLEEIQRFIEVHLSDPALSVAMVASGCGISPRRLSFLLNQHGLSFSKILWERRLAKARDWLAASTASEISVGEIAYSVGFKSPAHFSRMFKRVYSVNPSDLRSLAAAPG
jgi:AraC-like DNA-binding protein